MRKLKKPMVIRKSQSYEHPKAENERPLPSKNISHGVRAARSTGRALVSSWTCYVPLRDVTLRACWREGSTGHSVITRTTSRDVKFEGFRRQLYVTITDRLIFDYKSQYHKCKLLGCSAVMASFSSCIARKTQRFSRPKERSVMA
ncbi:hypothetical protein ElyMa_006928700 [Elysia marginata]|uniref:PiggyBac transposable element-derived protein domain-containing protein n=1 Tax=Elysia marginata TaxID=1093978 RepID=A0AAV4JKV4_9GAST|nr:hypothetical protein ElyMa_006928700 [Elysia marginata]